MTAILKTWPATMTVEHVLEAFTHDWARFYFTIGRGKPRVPFEELYFTHRGRILGHFKVAEIVQNAGQLPKLGRLDGGESEWQIKPDHWVAVCDRPFYHLTEKIFHDSFRGFRYFNLEEYSQSMEAKIRI